MSKIIFKIWTVNFVEPGYINLKKAHLQRLILDNANEDLNMKNATSHGCVHDVHFPSSIWFISIFQVI